MGTITFNNSTFSLNSFNRNTNFSSDTINSNGYCNIKYENNTNELHALAEEDITSIVIKNSRNETIYSLNNIEAHIISIDESYMGDNMTVNVNLQFNI